VLWKVDGLDDASLRRPMTPSGTTLLGLVEHLAAVELGWFCETFGRETEPLPFDPDDDDTDLRVGPDESTADILAFYGRARAAADRVIDDVGIEETARHAGHMDIVRELIDGATGDHQREKP